MDKSVTAFQFSDRCLHPNLMDSADVEEGYAVCTYCWDVVDPRGFLFLMLGDQIANVDTPRVPIVFGEIMTPIEIEIPEGTMFDCVWIIWDDRFQNADLPDVEYFHAEGTYTIDNWYVANYVDRERGEHHREYWQELPR